MFVYLYIDEDTRNYEIFGKLEDAKKFAEDNWEDMPESWTELGDQWQMGDYVVIMKLEVK